uniref:Uncharacterized protein n=1 Tax=Corethron hystrix TaxID=216773 RepID=A0A7S1FSJ4_9STRA|mmetsp:Transcript_2427/g.4666  ORF Transcript_2427/g.4666 Transcript_2427/m.4666 type:complete len:110 (+) Transcript_2427:495-824(+)
MGVGLNSGLLSPDWKFRNSFGSLDNSVGFGKSNGTDPSDTVREHIQRHLQQQKQQKQSLLMHENLNTFGANPSRIFSDQQSQGFLPSSLYSNMNKLSSLGQLDSSVSYC